MTRGARGLGIAIGLAVAGCAKVAPEADFQRAAALAEAAAGEPVAYRPGQEEASAARLAELLADGLTADEAAQVAVLNNPNAQAAFFDVAMARADAVQAGLLSNPVLGVALRLPDSGGLAEVEASLAQNIAELWQLGPRKAAAERDVDRAVLRLAQQVARAALEAKIAYYTAVGAAEVHAIALENQQLAEQFAELTAQRVRLGAGTEADANLARQAVFEAELVARMARLDANQARRELARQLGLIEDAGGLVLAEPLPEARVTESAAEAMVAGAIARRLDLQAADEAVAAAAARYKHELARVFPNVEVGLALEREARQAGPDRDLLADTARASLREGALSAPDIEPRSQRGGGQDFQIGPSLSMEIPLFDQNQAQIAKARYGLAQAERQREALRRAAVQDIRGAIDRAATAGAVVALYRDQMLPQAGRNVELTKTAYEAGKIPFITVLDTQRSFLETRSRLVTAMRDYATSLPRLELELGAPLTEALGAPQGGMQRD